MYQIWTYPDATGVMRYGIAYGFSDFGGTDVTQRFWRLDEKGMPMEFPNGGRQIDSLNGPACKKAIRVGAVSPGKPFKIEEPGA